MATIRITLKELGRDLTKRFDRIPKEINKGLRRGASLGKGVLVRRTPVDTGKMKNAWSSGVQAGVIQIHNDAPHAGIIEQGARPHKVNKAGIEALSSWAVRKLGVSPEEAKGIAFAISKKLEKRGQKGLFIVRDSQNRLVRIARQEVDRALRSIAGKRL